MWECRTQAIQENRDKSMERCGERDFATLSGARRARWSIYSPEVNPIGLW